MQYVEGRMQGPAEHIPPPPGLPRNLQASSVTSQFIPAMPTPLFVAAPMDPEQCVLQGGAMGGRGASAF